MTALTAFLDDFGSFRPAEQAMVQDLSDVELEGRRLEAFEDGYRAGWDDAIKAQSDDRSRISSALGQHLQDLSFTYHEAHAQVMNAMTPLLEEIVRVLLPEMARATLGAHIIGELRHHARESGGLEVVIAVSPANAEAVTPLLQNGFGFPVRLVEDDTLAEEQADIRFSDTERQIDLGALIDSIREAIDGFTHDNRRKLGNG